MHKHFNTAALQLRLCVVTVLLAVLGFALVAEFSDHASVSDDTVRVRVAEITEYSGDGEPPLSIVPLIAPPASMLIACVIPFALLILSRRRLTPRPVVVRHLYSRAPPSQS